MCDDADALGVRALEGRPAALRLEGVRKSFGNLAAVDGIDLAVAEGEFFTLLGPSGSGKTTLLRLIAGFETPDAGRIELVGRDVTRLPPYARETNTVFQDYALFPHMTVAENIEYGLRVKRVASKERTQRVKEALEMVRLPALGGRRPNQLSGGQRQRVALARAIVNRPKVLLLDEPLGALDLKLRQEMQVELKRIQQDVGLTFVYVTHDQEEALTMSDRIAVMAQGRIEQVDTPVAIYERPATEFVAGFIGISNVLTRNGRHWLVRPEKIRVLISATAAEPGDEVAEAVVEDVTYVGMVTRYTLRLVSGETVVASQQNLGSASSALQLKDHSVRATWRPDALFEIPSQDDNADAGVTAGTDRGGEIVQASHQP